MERIGRFTMKNIWIIGTENEKGKVENELYLYSSDKELGSQNPIKVEEVKKFVQKGVKVNFGIYYKNETIMQAGYKDKASCLNLSREDLEFLAENPQERMELLEFKNIRSNLIESYSKLNPLSVITTMYSEIKTEFPYGKISMKFYYNGDKETREEKEKRYSEEIIKELIGLIVNGDKITFADQKEEVKCRDYRIITEETRFEDTISVGCVVTTMKDDMINITRIKYKEVKTLNYENESDILKILTELKLKGIVFSAVKIDRNKKEIVIKQV